MFLSDVFIYGTCRYSFFCEIHQNITFDQQHCLFHWNVYNPYPPPPGPLEKNPTYAPAWTNHITLHDTPLFSFYKLYFLCASFFLLSLFLRLSYNHRLITSSLPLNPNNANFLLWIHPQAPFTTIAQSSIRWRCLSSTQMYYCLFQNFYLHTRSSNTRHLWKLYSWSSEVYQSPKWNLVLKVFWT